MHRTGNVLVAALIGTGLVAAVLIGLWTGRGEAPMRLAGPTRTPTSAPAPATATTPAQTATVPVPVTATPVLSTTQPLLVNGDFTAGFIGWSAVNGYWRIHDITGSSCDATNPDWPDYMAEMDRDKCSTCNTWPVGGQDWLWQDVIAPLPHEAVTLTLTEAHHMTSAGGAYVSLYGADEGEPWALLLFRPAPQAPWGAGHKCQTPPTFTHTLPVTEGGYDYYRLELSGALIDPNDGWIIGPLQLSVE